MSVAAKPVTLVVGVTGMLGDKIARAILDKGAQDVRALVRPGRDGVVRWRDLTENYRVRPRPDDVLRAIDGR